MERLVRLDCSHFCYSPPEEELTITRQPRTKESGTVFGCFNNTAKIHDDVIEAWSKILNAVPDSRLVLKWRCFDDKSVCSRVRAKFARFGIADEVLELRGASPHLEMMQQYNDIHIALDTFPFSGALTSCEALWMGVPVITLRQLRPVSRQTHGILNSLDLQSLSTANPLHYIETAIKLAGDSEFYRQCSNELRSRMLQAIDRDTPKLAEELEAFFNWSTTQE